MIRPPTSQTAQAHAKPLESTLFVALCGLLAVRPLIPEAFSSFDLPFADAGAGGPTRSATVWLDWLTLLISLISVIRSGTLPRSAMWGCGLLIAATVFSVMSADAKRVALNASGTLIAMSVAGVALTGMMRNRGLGFVLLAAMLATCGLNALKCFQQRAYEFNDTAEAWQHRKMELAQRGADIFDPLYTNFERRLLSQNAFGYLAHPNVAASVMMMGAVAAAGLAFYSLRLKGKSRTIAAIGGTALAIFLFLGIQLTGSKGALVAGICGVGIVVLLDRVFHGPRNRTVLVAAVSICSFAGLVGWGLWKGALPGDSLAFRWEYWTAAGRALPDAGWSGLGRENFIAAHMHYKAASATEEVRNPHNLWLSLLVEMGPLGLLAGIVLFAGTVRQLARARDALPDQEHVRVSVLTLLALLAVLPFLHGIFSGTPLSSAGIGLLWAVELAGAWCLLFGAGYWILNSAQPGRMALASIGLGVFSAGLMHNLIDFSLLMPSGLATFLALTAAGSDERADTSTMKVVVARWVGAACLGLVFFAVIVFPTASAESLSSRAEVAMQTARSPSDFETARVLLLTAGMSDSLDGEIPRKAAMQFLTLSQQAGTPANWRDLWFAHAQEFAQLARHRSPNAYGTLLLLARLAEFERDRGQPDESFRASNAADYWEQAIARYPTNALDRIDAAYAQIAVWHRTGSTSALDAAMRHFGLALEIDRTRPSENASKLRVIEIERIRDGLLMLQSGLPNGGVTSMPESTSAPSTMPAP